MYYDLLGVEVDATDVQIKKGYRRAALKWHPDKNPGDEAAETKFKEVAQAYQILSDPQQRAFYDEVGVEGMLKHAENGGAQDVDPKEFFTSIFGGEGFKDYIGELGFLKMMFDNEDEEGEEGKDEKVDETGVAHYSEDAAKTFSQLQEENKQKAKEARKKIDAEMIKKQREEELKKVKELADKLKEKMSNVVEHNKGSSLDSTSEDWKKFQKQTLQDVEDLKLESFGLDICHLIGKVYKFKGDSYLKSKKTFTGGFHKFSSNFKQSKDTVKGMYDMVSQASEAQSAMEAMSLLEQEGGDEQSADMDPYLKAEMEQTMTGKFISVAWASSKFEIQQTLYAVCNEVLQDKTVSTDVKKLRAQVLIHMGLLFSQAKREDDSLEDTLIFEKMMKDARAKKARDIKRESAMASPALGSEHHKKTDSDEKASFSTSSAAEVPVEPATTATAEDKAKSKPKSKFGFGLKKHFNL